MRKTWINFISLLPATLVTLLATCVAFLRFYDQNDFKLLRWVAHPRVWSNRLTLAALVAALANFGVEWYRRNRETSRLEEEEARRVAQERAAADRRAEERERTARRARIEARCRAAQIRFQLDPNAVNRQGLIDSLVLLEEYGDTL